MKTYTKEQLIAAQEKWNTKLSENTQDFQDLQFVIDDPKKAAAEQIDYLLSLVDDK